MKLIKPWYDLKTGLAASLGKTLLHWSRNANSYPGLPGQSFEDWQAELAMYGSMLLRYGKSRYDANIANYKVVDGKVEGSEFNWHIEMTADGFFVSEDEASEIEAKYAMKWVYENFYTLWD